MSRAVSVAVATVLFLLVVAAVTGAGWVVVFFGLVAAGVAFGAIGIVGAVRRAGRAPVEWPDAWVGVATVTRLRSTTELKDGRRLITMDVRVEPADGSAPFDSVFTRRVAADAVPGVQPGLQFPAMWRQDRREKVKIARGPKREEAQRFFDQVRVRDGLVDRLELEAVRRGLPAEAEVLRVDRTGRTVSGVPVFAVELRILHGDLPTIVKEMPLSDFQYGLLVAARRVRVRYLPDNPRAVAVAIEKRQEAVS